ncbi:TPA: protease [Klebsiella variicola]|nr:protease [Klebsiella variicola]
MKTKPSSIGIAILTATMDADGWCQLLPAGHFRARDGRPFDVPDGWFMDGTIAARLIDGVRALGQDILIDYEHNQLRKHEGLSADDMKAAGWFNADEMQWRDGRGLYIRPRWTPTARDYITREEYGFLSAVFPYDTTGAPTLLRMAALTNDPGATGMEKLVALAASFADFHTPPHEDTSMNELLRQLLARLGISGTAENADITDEQATAALSAFDLLKGKADKHDALTASVATLSAELTTVKAAADKVDLTKFVPLETYNALRQQMADLSGEHSTASLSAVLDDAERDGRIFKSERGYFEQLGGQIGVAALSAQLKDKQPIAALTALQTTTTTVADPRRERLTALSADEKAAAKALGMTDAEYLKLREEDNQ